MAIQLFDRCALNMTPSGEIKVFLKDLKRKAIRNLSGNFAYLNLEDGEHTVCIETVYYLKKEFDVTLPFLPSPPENVIDIGNDVKLKSSRSAVIATVDLMPDVNYPFPSGATLIRGEVIKTENGMRKPVSDSIIHITDLQQSPPEEKELEFKANKKGQFVMYMNKLTRQLIKEINGKEFNGWKVNEQRLLMLRAVHPVLGEKSKEVIVEDGETTYAKIQF